MFTSKERLDGPFLTKSELAENLKDLNLKTEIRQSSVMELMSPDKTAKYLNGENSLEMSQHAFTLSGRCKIDASHPAFLIATVGNNVVGMSSIHATGCLSMRLNDNPQLNVLFSLQLEPRILVKKVKGTVVFTLFNGNKTALHRVSCAELLVNGFESFLSWDSIAPSYGFFGGGKNEALKVNIDAEITELHLCVESSQTILNLKAIKFFDAQRNQIEIDDNFSITCSSSYNPDLGSLKILEGKDFHSKLEDKPWLKVTLNCPHYIQHIEVINRACKWGGRNQHLEISIVDLNDERVNVYSPFSYRALARFYSKAANFLGLDTLFISNEHERRKTILSQALKLLNKKGSKPEHVNFALNLLSTWVVDKPLKQNLNNNELKILAIYIFRQTQQHLGFSLLPFSRLLSGARELNFLEKQVNTLRKKNVLDEVKFTKHGIAKKGMLVQNVPDVVKTLETVMTDLTDIGLNPCLAYGTLLGAVRQKQFIAHDDDVDILVEFSESEMSLEKAFELKIELMEKLDHAKYRITSGSKTVKNLNIHILLKETNVIVDVFPYWCEGEKAFLHMEKMRIRGISKSILTERKEVELYGKKFAAPGEPEVFLQERYGENWGVSDKFHEWPWPVKTDKST
ncbi:LicD family protein [Brumicola nitratireducens]|uniref:LicD/FKTN/FKRP nucleotidyltransferase domain-containing protein n=1 Tax=Glaciecola nitratireducens (strain JCM 12485 / KCTC 12276 / FR1064) TaxID=1085623 RepID=G4QIQ9_GLANF|nr:LicD family protein [Glaciecola nitratireducens]AEP31214.1 hypothetical protein GNIT_3119 [Glaciecola nitratireducens FR1064]